MNVYYIDFTDVSDRESLFHRMKEVLPVPAETGNNLDALHDALTEYGAGWDVIIYNAAEAAEKTGPWFRRFRRMCADCAAEGEMIQIRIYP